MRRDEVARHQKARLEGAMVEAVARHGFAATTVRELVTLAGVSKTTFYDHFEGKEECFLATFESIIDELAEEVAATYEGAEDPRERLPKAFERFMELVVERPRRVALVTVDSLTLGVAAVSRRERAWETFEELVRRYFDEVEPGAAVSELVLRALIAGTTGVVYRRLRSGRAEELPGLVEPLIGWALGYSQPDSEMVRRAVSAAARPALRPREVGEGDEVPWEEPPHSPRSRSSLSQRDRIIRAAAKVVVERGFDALSIPAISAAAGISNQTFYENFSSKRDALLAAHEALSSLALETSSAPLTAEAAGPEALGVAVRSLTEYIAGNPIYARLAFFELPKAGPPALDRADQTLDLLIAFLEPGRVPKGFGGPVPRVALEATAAGIWFVIQREIGEGRAESLPELAPALTRIALSPLD
ncbi:MAG TPA: TetR/AcrR family transcriptional regulator [Solirubrobacterales bacterium]|nr:TetR/AcrR family transcriptional regulator [Solirubrobacterales bacterium]